MKRRSVLAGLFGLVFAPFYKRNSHSQETIPIEVPLGIPVIKFYGDRVINVEELFQDVEWKENKEATKFNGQIREWSQSLLAWLPEDRAFIRYEGGVAYTAFYGIVLVKRSKRQFVYSCDNCFIDVHTPFISNMPETTSKELQKNLLPLSSARIVLRRDICKNC